MHIHMLFTGGRGVFMKLNLKMFTAAFITLILLKYIVD